MSASPNENIEDRLLDSRIRSLLHRSLAGHNPPPDGKQRLMREILDPAPQVRKTRYFWHHLIEFLMLPNDDPDSTAISQTLALSNARVFGFPGALNLNIL